MYLLGGQRRKMKRKIEIEIDLPDYIGEDFIKMLSMLDSKQLNLVKGTVIGMLLADNKISYDDIDKKLLLAGIGKEQRD